MSAYANYFGLMAKRFLTDGFNRVIRASEDGNDKLLTVLVGISESIKENTEEVRRLREVLEPKKLNKFKIIK